MYVVAAERRPMCQKQKHHLRGFFHHVSHSWRALSTFPSLGGSEEGRAGPSQLVRGRGKGRREEQESMPPWSTSMRPCNDGGAESSALHVHARPRCRGWPGWRGGQVGEAGLERRPRAADATGALRAEQQHGTVCTWRLSHASRGITHGMVGSRRASLAQARSRPARALPPPGHRGGGSGLVHARTRPVHARYTPGRATSCLGGPDMTRTHVPGKGTDGTLSR